jgi:hypothetical protein
MAKWVALTARKLKPGSYDDWREAWGSVDGPSGATAYICRNVNDADEIVAFGMIEATREELMEMRPQGDSEDARLAAMAPHVESVGTDGIYEVIDEVTF